LLWPLGWVSGSESDASRSGITQCQPAAGRSGPTAVRWQQLCRRARRPAAGATLVTRVAGKAGSWSPSRASGPVTLMASALPARYGSSQSPWAACWLRRADPRHLLARLRSRHNRGRIRASQHARMTCPQ
jgi:hypothetical protein